MSSVTRCATAVVFSALCSSVAAADPVTLVKFERYVYATALVYGPSGFVAVYDQNRKVDAGDTSSAQAAYGGTTVVADSYLSTTLSGDFHRLSGTTTASSTVNGPVGGGQAGGGLSFWFDIAEAHAFEFVGDFSKFGFGGWQTHLMKDPSVLGGQTMRFAVSSNTGSDQQLRFRGSLDPGRYVLYVRADAVADTVFGNRPNGGGTFDFTYDMTPVPEPASMLLVGSGILGLASRARRRRP
jgi:hypothetical protein